MSLALIDWGLVEKPFQLRLPALKWIKIIDNYLFLVSQPSFLGRLDRNRQFALGCV